MVTATILYINMSICHDMNGFDMACHGSQAISICAEKRIILLENYIANLIGFFMKFVLL